MWPEASPIATAPPDRLILAWAPNWGWEVMARGTPGKHLDYDSTRWVTLPGYWERQPTHWVPLPKSPEK